MMNALPCITVLSLGQYCPVDVGCLQAKMGKPVWEKLVARTEYQDCGQPSDMLSHIHTGHVIHIQERAK